MTKTQIGKYTACKDPMFSTKKTPIPLLKIMLKGQKITFSCIALTLVPCFVLSGHSSC